MQQCPRCLRHVREYLFDSKNGKSWRIERCAYTECRFNFDIREWKLDIEPGTIQAMPDYAARKRHVGEDVDKWEPI